MFEIIILSLIQGVTEFLPVSSSSHLILVANYLDYQKGGLSADVSLHIGSFLAVTIYFKKDIFNFISNKILFLKIFIASIPVMLVGAILVNFNLTDYLRDVRTIGWTTLIFGILLFISDKSDTQNKIENNLTIKSVIFIGLMQVLSLIPGVSRSGVTITGARFLKFKRFDAAKISFLLSIPTLAAVSLFGIKNLIDSNSLEFTYENFILIFLSFIFSLLTINYFLKFIKKFSLKFFVIYRIILGTMILLIYYL